MENKVFYTPAQIETLLQEKNYRLLKAMSDLWQPQDIAEVINELDSKNALIVFRLLGKEKAAETFVEMDADTQSKIVQSVSDTELNEIISELYADDVADIIEEMPANAVKRILASADSETRKSVNELLKYSVDSAGSIMTTEYVRLERDLTVKESLTRIRRIGIDKETIYSCYVTDSSKVLLGVVTAKDLLLNDEDVLIEDIMLTTPVHVLAQDDRETAVREMLKYDLSALPVTDGEKRLVGIITIDDAADVLQQEVTEDMDVMAAISPSAKPYLKTGIWEIFKNRIPWLLLLMLSATFTGQIITGYEDKLAVLGAVTLTAFIPMLMGTGGNAGGQASVTVIRELATENISVKDIGKILLKEIGVAILCGVALSAAGFLKIIIIDNLIFSNGISYSTAAVVCITMFLTVLTAKAVGCTLPLLAKLCRLDPAVMASPLITTVIDAVSLIIYFKTAIFILA